MYRTLVLSMAALLLSGSGAMFAQAEKSKAEQTVDNTKARARNAATDKDATLGRIKELTPGQKVVIDVDNAPDKTFDLTNKDVTVKLAPGLKVGDPVKVVELEELGKTKSVTISKHTGAGTHGDPK